MTRTTNARIAGFTYLFYAAIGICYELLMPRRRASTVMLRNSRASASMRQTCA